VAKGKQSQKEKVFVPLAPEPAEDRFAPLNATINRRFFEPDLQAVRITLGTIQSHYLNIGDPAWLFNIAPPSTGKTTVTIMGAAELRDVVLLGAITPNTLLSGYNGQREPGVLEKLGETTQQDRTFTTTGNGILLIKDFTTILSMRRETRAEILSQLREIHDGEFRKSFGTGDTKVWRGRITIVAAVTPAIDRHYSVFGTLGQRFLQLRWHRPRSPKAGQQAIRQQGAEESIRREIQQDVKLVFAGAPKSVPTLNAKADKRLAYAAELVAIARTHVPRSSYGNRDIESLPEPEGNSRIAKGLAAIAKGVASLNGRRNVEEPDLQDAFRVATDSIPDNRWRLLLSIVQGKSPKSVGLPPTIKTRELEELEALGLITMPRTGSTPQLTKQTSKLFQTAGIVINTGRLSTRPPSTKRTASNDGSSMQLPLTPPSSAKS
jgi:hypothetical protein